jgi:predicted restriction endonuclease
MAREFLLFLRNYGYLGISSTPERGNRFQKFVLSNISIEEIRELESVVVDPVRPELTVKSLQQTQIPANIERKKVSRELLERPYQSKFRKNILIAFNSKCLITGVNIENVLEAAHIVPVANNGSDQTDNGLCLRSDIHQLYDSGHLKLLPTGEIRLSEPAKLGENYGTLPSQIAIPDFVSKKHLLWRWKYA